MKSVSVERQIVRCLGMVSERAMKSVLHNFLETYTSRYSDYDGFWVFGFIVETMLPANIDLMASSDFRS